MPKCSFSCTKENTLNLATNETAQNIDNDNNMKKRSKKLFEKGNSAQACE